MLRIVAPNFVAGVEIENGLVRDAAPIVHYMLGWPHSKVSNFCYLKGWSVTELHRRRAASDLKLHGSIVGIEKRSDESPEVKKPASSQRAVVQCQDRERSLALWWRRACMEDRASTGWSNENMNLKTKLIQWENKGYYLIVVCRGELTKASIKSIFRTIRDATRTILACKILIDLQDATTFMTSSDIDTLAGDLDFAFSGHGIVFVCPAESQQYFALRALSTGLASLGHRAAVFGDAKLATDWLATME